MVNILFLIFFVDGFCDCLLAYPGDIWSGSEGGNIRVWPWESVEKSLSLSPEENTWLLYLWKGHSLTLGAKLQLMVSVTSHLLM